MDSMFVSMPQIDVVISSPSTSFPHSLRYTAVSDIPFTVTVNGDVLAAEVYEDRYARTVYAQETVKVGIHLEKGFLIEMSQEAQS